MPDVGEIFRQPNLARTLRAIAAADKASFAKTHNRVTAIHAGRDAFYTGDIAHRIADADKAAGGVFSYDDLASFHGAIEKPVTTSFHGYDVYKAGPWNQGPVLLQTLNILEGIDLKSLGVNSADYIHQVHEAIKLAYDDRNAYYGDPAFAQGADDRPAVEGVRAERRGADRAAGVARAARRRSVQVRSVGEGAGGAYTPHSQGAGPAPPPATRPASTSWTRTETCSARRPVRAGCSAGAFIAGDTGVPLSNRMTVFDLDPLSPNVLVGGKRPRTTLTPTIVLKDGEAVSRDQHARRRQPGSADPERPARDDRVRQGHPGGDRSAAYQLAAPVRIVRLRTRASLGVLRDREPTRSPRRAHRPRSQAQSARAVRDEHRRGGGRRQSRRAGRCAAARMSAANATSSAGEDE